MQSKSATWTELDKIEGNIRGYSVRRTEILSNTTSTAASVDAENLPTSLAEELDSLNNSLGALYNQRDELVKGLKTFGHMTYFPESTGAQAPLGDILAQPEGVNMSDHFQWADALSAVPSPATQHQAQPKRPFSFFSDTFFRASPPKVDPPSSPAEIIPPTPAAASPAVQAAPLSLGGVARKSRVREVQLAEIFRRAEEAREGHPDNVHVKGKAAQVHPYLVVTHMEKLEAEVQMRRQSQAELTKTAEHLGQRLGEDLRTLEQQALHQLKHPYRNLFFAQCALLEVRIEHDRSAAASLQERVVFGKSVLDSLPDDADQVPAALLMPSKTYLAHDPVVSLKEWYCHALERRVKERAQELALAKVQAKRDASVAARKARLQEILSQRLSEETCPYPLDWRVISDFRTTLQDSRTLNGRWLQNATGCILGEEQPGSDQLFAFLDEFSLSVASELKLADRWALQAFVNCIFFMPLHLHLLASLDTPELRAADDALLAALPALRAMSPEQLHLNARYLCPPPEGPQPAQPFQGAIRLLSDLPLLLSPIELLLCLERTTSLACEEAEVASRSKEGSGISADDLVPLLTFVAIHAEIGRVNLLLQFLNEYTPDCYKRGKLGYCLTSFQITLMFIQKQLIAPL